MFRNILGWIIIIGLVACGGKSKEDSLQSENKAQPVTVTFYSGEAKILRGGVETSPSQGMSLNSDDQITTGPNGRLEVLVQNSGLVKISHSSSVSISSLMHSDKEGSDTNIHLAYGKVVTVVRKEKKNESVNVVTPTLVAGVRGTIFMTSVENPNADGDIACSQNDCLVKVNVVEGAVAVRQKESGDEVIVEKNSGIAVKGKESLRKELVKSLGKKSLDELKDMIVFHKSNIGGFENLADELKLQTRELSELDSAGSLSEIKTSTAKKTSGKTNDEARKVADETDESKYLQKDISREKLKMDPKETF